MKKTIYDLNEGKQQLTVLRRNNGAIIKLILRLFTLLMAEIESKLNCLLYLHEANALKNYSCAFPVFYFHLILKGLEQYSVLHSFE